MIVFELLIIIFIAKLMVTIFLSCLLVSISMIPKIIDEIKDIIDKIKKEKK